MRVYPIHRAIGRPMLFKGFRAQYIVLAALGLIGDLLLFVLLYCCRAPPSLCMATAFVVGGSVLWIAAWLSRTFGAHGLMKHFASKSIPTHIRCRSRRIFLHLKNSRYVKGSRY